MERQSSSTNFWYHVPRCPAGFSKTFNERFTKSNSSYRLLVPLPWKKTEFRPETENWLQKPKTPKLRPKWPIFSDSDRPILRDPQWVITIITGIRTLSRESGQRICRDNIWDIILPLGLEVRSSEPEPRQLLRKFGRNWFLNYVQFWT